MKLKFFATIIGTLLLTATVICAADLTGKWKTEVGGDRVFNLTLTQKGETLEGVLTNPRGKEFKLKDGKLKGDAISFTLAGQGRLDGLKFSGTVKGEEIHMKAEGDAAAAMGKLIWKRVAEK